MKKILTSLAVFAAFTVVSQAQLLLSVDFNAQYYNATEPGFTGIPYTTTYPTVLGAYTLTLTSDALNMGTGSSESDPVANAALWKDYIGAGDFGTLTMTIGGLTAGNTYTFTAWSWRGGLGSAQNVVYTPINGTGGTGGTITYESAAPDDLGDYSITRALTANGSGELVLTISAGSYNGTLVNGFELSAIPEPSAWLMVGLGVIGLAGLNRRRVRAVAVR